jgi:hypothetical protein
MGESTFYLAGEGRLQKSPAPEAHMVLHPVQTVGVAAGNWCPSGMGAPQDLDTELPSDQRIDDARSLVFDSAPLPHSFEILGAPQVTLKLAVDKPVAFIAVRLNEVSAAGESNRVTYGILNLCHRDGHASPAPLDCGTRYTVRLELDHAAHRFHAGNRLRLSISTAYWPLILPAPEPVILSLYTAASLLTLPVRPPWDEDECLRPFEPAFVPKAAVERMSAAPGAHAVDWNAADKKQITRHEVGNSVVLLTAIQTRLFSKATMRAEIGENDTEGSIEYEFERGWARAPWRPRVVASSKVTAARNELWLRGEIVAFNGDEQIFARVWDRRIPRRLV